MTLDWAVLTTFLHEMTTSPILSGMQELAVDDFPVDCSQTQASEDCMLGSEQPAHGIPVVGTIVMGVPLGGATTTRRGYRQPKQAKAKQSKPARRGKAATEAGAAELAKEQSEEATNAQQRGAAVSLYDDHVCYQTSCPYMQLPESRSTSAVKTQ